MTIATIRKRFITPEDLYRFLLVGDPQIAPDGRTIAYGVKSILPDHKKYRSQIWKTDLDGKATGFVTSEADDTMPRWSPDGCTLAFVRTLEEKAQIHLAPAAGGEPRALTTLPPGRIKALEWSPDGTRLAFVFHPRPATAPPPKEQPIARHVTRLRHKQDGDGFLDGEFDHIWIAAVADGRAQPLTQGDWDDAYPAWSPDSAHLAFASNRLPDADYRLMEVDLWVVPAAGGPVRRLPKPAGPVDWPAWSPDGKSIAWLGHDRPEESWGTTNTHLWVVGASGQPAARDLIPGFDRTCEDVVITDTKSFHGVAQRPVWSPDGRELYFVASDRGSCHIYRVAAAGGQPEKITHGTFEVMQFSLGAGRLAMTLSDPMSISEAYVLDTAPKAALRRVTAANDALFGELALSAPEELDITSFDGQKIQGWLLKPLLAATGRKRPLVVQIHGGPRAQYGWAFFHELQMLAGMGYSVLYVNPRGSQGYGEKFARATLGDWGNLDYRDLMAAVDHAERLGFVDEDRLGVCGGSYGGYMTNWIVGHTDRFRAAITMRCVSNLFSMSGTSDIGYEDHREFRRHPFDDPALYARLSPITYVKNIKTPLLITHGEMDLRCPVEQAEQMFAFLKAMKREVEMVRFPEETHDLSRSGRPDRRVARLEHIARWWKRWLE